MIASEKSLIVFHDKKIRRLWHDDEWFYSVSDIIAVLTDSKDELAYWRKLKQREPQLVTICHGLKLPAADGKLRYADCVNTKNHFHNALLTLFNSNCLLEVREIHETR